MKKTKIKKEIQIETSFTYISFEELKQFEYDIEYNPFDTTGSGYLDEDFTEFLIKQNEKASEHYNK